MIKTSVEVRSDHRQPKTFITCPQCCQRDYFYSFVHRTCEGCGFPWGNVIALMENVRVRKHYFIKGEID